MEQQELQEQVALGLLSIVQNDEVRSLVRDVLREEMFPDELKGLDASDFEDSFVQQQSKEIRKDIANSSTKFIEDIEMLDACAKDCLCDNIVSLRRRIISKKFLGAKSITLWTETDNDGAVFEWPGEKVVLSLVATSEEEWIVSVEPHTDKAHIAVFLRSIKFYEERLDKGESEARSLPSLALVTASITDAARTIARRHNISVLML